MKYSAMFAAIVAGLTTLFLATPSALACDPTPPSPEFIVPANGDRVGPNTEIVVIGQGERPHGGGDFSLTDRSGSEVAVEAEVIERGLFSWLVVYRPVEPLSPTAYDFFVSYPSQGGDPATVLTSFQVQQTDELTLFAPEVTWDTILFRPDFQGQCESFASATRVAVEPARQGDQPLWYEVVLRTEDESESVTRAVVPGLGQQGGGTSVREFREQFAVGCVSVTPVGPAGERGETIESCGPALCDRVDPDEVDLETMWEDVPECGDTAPGQSSGGSGEGSSSDDGCTVSSMPTDQSSPWWLLLAAFIALPLRRRRR